MVEWAGYDTGTRSQQAVRTIGRVASRRTIWLKDGPVSILVKRVSGNIFYTSSVKYLNCVGNQGLTPKQIRRLKCTHIKSVCAVP